MNIKMNTEQIASRFNNVAQKYDNQRKLFIPCYDEYYGIVRSFLKSAKTEVASVLDLGAGTGLLTKIITEIYPDATYTLIDLSDKMIDAAKSRFTNRVKMEYLVDDYVAHFPQRTYDLILSALSIHHLEDDDKTGVYKNVYRSLNENGFFINLDQFNADSKTVNSMYTDCWYEFINGSGIDEGDKVSWRERRALDRENSIPETIQMIKSAGFVDVECIYQYMKFGVVIARKAKK